MEIQLKPKLRFPDFQGVWNSIKLGDLMTFKNGVNASKENYGFGYKFINVLDIINNNIITNDLIIGEVNITEKEFEKNIVQYGDILFQRSSETREEVGQSNVYLDDLPATFGGFVIRGKSISEYNSLYLHYLLKTSKARLEITTKSGGSTRFNVGQETLSNVIINISSSLPEQQKIADYLATIDTKINLLEEKKEQLTLYKKAMMQKLFSQEIRFKDDKGNDFTEWEEKRLGEISKITTGKLDANAMIPNGEFRFYTCAKEYYKIDKYAFDCEALLISGNGANVGYIHHYNGKFNAYQRTYVLTDLDQNFEFIKFQLEQFLHKRIFKEKKEGNTPYIVLSTLTEMLLQVPVREEQQKIANFLSAIDESIEKVNQQITQTQSFKKAMLQQMFL